MHKILSKSTRKWLYPILILLGIVIIIGCVGKSMMTSFREELENPPPNSERTKLDDGKNRDKKAPNPNPLANDNAYILKSSIVPPVCPKCPDLISSNKEKKCPPCPPCGRCPETKLKCESVFSPLASANDLSIVRPNLTPQI